MFTVWLELLFPTFQLHPAPIVTFLKISRILFPATEAIVNVADPEPVLEMVKLPFISMLWLTAIVLAVDVEFEIIRLL